MSGKCLVVYASRFGCSQEIGQKIGDILEEEGYECHVINLRDSKKKNWPYINAYKGVILGTGIQMGQWAPEARKYLKEITEDLNKNIVKYALYVSAASAEVDCGKAKVNYIDKMVEKFNVRPPDLSEAFAGVLDFSEDSKIGKLKREALKLAAKEMVKENGDMKIDFEGCNDLRDWDLIEQFARDFAILLK